MNEVDSLLEYKRLVQEYAKVLDLASPRMLEQFNVGIERSKSFAEHLEPEDRVLDVGSGAGLPGIPLAILRPNIQLTLCEIRVKRAAFLERVVSRIGLRHVTVYNGDVQKIDGLFNTVTALWIGDLAKLFRLTRHILEPEWKFVVRKGDELETELEALKRVANVTWVHVKHLEDGARMATIKGVT
ncbi:MAG: 16S rRNA (guanine(527)-N(7))-methyltransferase RsmG [Pleurocapsa sp. SU_196_0]|nr:16S rRNA (guanine(527)-N(7))-methyltransferase RsmG [Pleurocapsa sp. SU_196_0]